MLNLLPWLDWLPGDMFCMKQVLANADNVINKFLYPQIHQHQKDFVSGEHTDFIHAYLDNIQQVEKEGRETTLNGRFLYAN